MSISYGMIPNGSVADALTGIVRSCEKNWLAVIRSLDSSRETDDLAKVLAFHQLAYDLINGNVCLTIDHLRIALAAEAFTGFDEVWMIAGPPPATDLASMPRATSESTDFSSGVPDGLSSTMKETNCVLILGDGCGLNYATTSQQIEDALVGETQ